MESTIEELKFVADLAHNGGMMKAQNEALSADLTKLQTELNEKKVQLMDFKFFRADRFDTMERQQVLRSAVNGVLPRMDTESGRDWVAVYIAYHYYMERELIMKCHADFFADIDRLLPGVLKRVNKAETGADKRYKAYTDTLRLECKCWFILNECLPPMQEWTSAKYPYPVDDDRRKRIQKLVIEIYQRLKKS